MARLLVRGDSASLRGENVQTGWRLVADSIYSHMAILSLDFMGGGARFLLPFSGADFRPEQLRLFHSRRAALYNVARRNETFPETSDNPLRNITMRCRVDNSFTEIKNEVDTMHVHFFQM